jgi:hypothetical protein
MLYKSYIASLYVRNIHKNIGKTAYITVAAILASMVLIPSAITLARPGYSIGSKSRKPINVWE